MTSVRARTRYCLAQGARVAGLSHPNGVVQLRRSLTGILVALALWSLTGCSGEGNTASSSEAGAPRTTGTSRATGPTSSSSSSAQPTSVAPSASPSSQNESSPLPTSSDRQKPNITEAAGIDWEECLDENDLRDARGTQVLCWTDSVTPDESVLLYEYDPGQQAAVARNYLDVEFVAPTWTHSAGTWAVAASTPELLEEIVRNLRKAGFQD